jgi:spore cortex formation protein SpoVR/YcgB (stage V sporulation)
MCQNDSQNVQINPYYVGLDFVVENEMWVQSPSFEKTHKMPQRMPRYTGICE